MQATVAGALGLCLVAFSVSKGAAFEAEPFHVASPFTPVVVFGADQRASVEDFARKRQMDAAELRQKYAGTGIIRCGNAHGSGQLTLADDVVTTAAHVLYDHTGHLRGDSAHCRFEVETDGQKLSIPLEVNGAIAGSTDPYNESAVHDWAVVKLARPLPEATPYPLAAPSREEPIRFVARGSIDWDGGHGMSLQDCHLRDGLENGAEGTREFSFDCSANVGASGSGLLDGDGKALVAVFVGYRSVAPDQALPFSPTHYNFAVTVEGAFRRAVERQASLGATAQAKSPTAGN
jgi:hypothetical protein